MFDYKHRETIEYVQKYATCKEKYKMHFDKFYEVEIRI